MSHLGLDLLHAVMGLRKLTLAVCVLALLEFAATPHAANTYDSRSVPRMGRKGGTESCQLVYHSDIFVGSMSFLVFFKLVLGIIIKVFWSTNDLDMLCILA